MNNVRIAATFEGWKLHPDFKPVLGPFLIEIRLSERGRRSIYRAIVGGTLQEFAKEFKLNELEECKSYVKAQFEKQVTEWREL